MKSHCCEEDLAGFDERLRWLLSTVEALPHSHVEAVALRRYLKRYERHCCEEDLAVSEEAYDVVLQRRTCPPNAVVRPAAPDATAVAGRDASNEDLCCCL